MTLNHYRFVNFFSSYSIISPGSKSIKHHYIHNMKRPVRYALYFMIGFLIYQIIDSGETSFTHQDARDWLIGAIVVIFVLLVIVRLIKQRYDK